jgi:hypothetical protein
LKSGRPLHQAVLLLAAIGGAALMLWTALGSWTVPALGPRQEDYYNSLVRGFRKGSLALDLAVPEALTRMEDPWDASKRPPDLAPHDVSYYQGHYYLYFGVVPAVLLFWPFRALTGVDLPFVWSAVVFGVGAYLASAWLWLRLVRDQFPRAGLLTRLAGVAALGLVGGQLALERRVAMWEVPIESGHFFMIGLLIAGYLALGTGWPRTWLAAAGLALGLAVGSRPSLIAAGPALAALAVAVGLRPPVAGTRRGRLGRVVAASGAAGIPLALLLAALFAYNHARFGRWTEFGTTYQLSGGYDYRNQPFSFAFLPHNLRIYFWSRPQWGRYFPFLHPVASTRAPAGYYGVEYVYGALTICPVLWWAVFAPLGAAGRRRGDLLRAFVGFVALIAAGTTLLLLCFNVAAARYVVDFLPWWVWLALLGWAELEGWLGARGPGAAPGPRAAGALFGASVLASCVLALCASAEVHGVLRFSNPKGYAELARFFDTPVAWWERLTRFRGGAMEMTVTFPERPSGSVEPLAVTGVEYQKDYVFVFYTDSHHVQLGFDTILGRSPVKSAVLAVTPGRPYRLRIEGGPFYPPRGHPAYDGWRPAEVRAFTDWIRLDLDGRTVLDAPTAVDESAPELIKLGSDGPEGLYGARFVGAITQVSRSALPSRAEPAGAQTGDVWLQIVFPAAGSPITQPLVVAGKPGLAQLLGLQMVDADHYVLTQEIWGAGLWKSGVLKVPPGRQGTFRVRLGALLGVDDRSPQGPMAHTLAVWLGPDPVWWRRDLGAVPPLGPAPAVDVGENFVGSSAMSATFQGRLEGWGRTPLPAWKGGAFAAAAIDLAGRDAGTEPLVTSGRPDAADILEIEWEPRGGIHFVYRHGREYRATSVSLPWSSTALHHLRVATPAMGSLDRGVREGSGTLAIELDHRVVWKAAVLYFGAEAGSLAIGSAGVAAAETRPALVCTFLDIQQEAFHN